MCWEDSAGVRVTGSSPRQYESDHPERDLPLPSVETQCFYWPRPHPLKSARLLPSSQKPHPVQQQVIPSHNRLLPPLPSAVWTELSTTLLDCCTSLWLASLLPPLPPPAARMSLLKAKLDPSPRIFQQLLASLRKSQFYSKDQQAFSLALSPTVPPSVHPVLATPLPVCSRYLSVSGSLLPQGCCTYGSVCWETYFPDICTAHPSPSSGLR